jgi:hypothetical protein
MSTANSSKQRSSLKVGETVRLKLEKFSSVYAFTITYVGSKSVKVKDEFGREHLMSRRAAWRQIYGRRKGKKLTRGQRRALKRRREARIISTPMGGQPGYKKGVNRSNY